VVYVNKHTIATTLTGGKSGSGFIAAPTEWQRRRCVWLHK